MVLSEKGKGELRKFLNFSITTMLSQTLRFFKKFKYRALTQLIEREFLKLAWISYLVKHVLNWEHKLVRLEPIDVVTFYNHLFSILVWNCSLSMIVILNLLDSIYPFISCVCAFIWMRPLFHLPLTQIANLLLSIVSQFWAYA